MAAKNTSNNAYTDLRRDLKAGTPKRLYVFHGEERYLMEHAEADLRRLLIPKGTEAFNYRTFSGTNLDLEELNAAVNSFPFLGEHTLILVTDFDLFGCGESKKARLTEMFSDLPDYLCLVFVYDTLEFKIGQGKFQNLVKKVGAVVEFAPASPDDLLDWIRRRFAALDKDIDDRDGKYLISLCGGLMTGLESEIEKISGFAKGRRVTRTDIDAVAEPVLESRVFDVTDAVGQQDFEQALVALSELYRLNLHPIMILTVLGRHLRQLYTARLMLDSGKGAPALKEMWNLKTDWQANRLMRSAHSCSPDWCRRAVRLVGEADLAMKSTGRDEKDILTDLVLRLARA